MVWGTPWTSFYPHPQWVRVEVRWNGVSLTGRSWVTQFCYFEMEGRMGNTTKGLTDPPESWGFVPPGSRPYPHPIPVNSEVNLCPLWNTLPSLCLTWSCLSPHAVPMFWSCREVSCVLPPQLSVARACPSLRNFPECGTALNGVSVFPSGPIS